MTNENKYYRVFDDGNGNGWWFPCDNQGVLKPMPPVSKKQYDLVMSSSDKYVRFNHIVKE